MSANFIAALKAEIAELEAELRDDPRQRRLALLRQTLSEYEPTRKMVNIQVAMSGTSTVTATATLLSKEARIKAELARYFKEHGPTHRSILLEHLKNIGLMGNEKTPMASFAAYLSSWKDTFTFDGNGVWGLHEQFEDAEESEEAPS